jgi:hypothetical protein
MLIKGLKKWGSIGAFTFFFVLLAHLFPLSGDDWQWGSSWIFATFNGRYAGNLLERIITHFLWLRPFVVGLTVSVIAWILSRFWGTGRRGLPALLLVVFVPQSLFTQVYQWSAGFANYTFPVMLLLIVLVIVLRLDRAPTRLKIPLVIALLTLSFLSTLFAEHITIGAVAIAFLYCLFRKFFQKKWDVGALLSLVGLGIGAFVMFSNSSYHQEMPGAHTMPKFSEMGLNALKNYRNIMVPQMVTANFAITCTMCLLCFLLVKSSKEHPKLAKGLSLFFMCMIALCLVRLFHPTIVEDSLWKNGESGLAIVYLVAVCVTFLLFLPKGNTKIGCLFGLIAILLFSAPLLPVSPIGSRCFFIIDAVFILIMGVLSKHLYEHRKIPENSSVSYGIFAMILVVLCTKFYVYGNVTKLVSDRQEYVTAQLKQNATEIEVPNIPFMEYVWQINLSTPYTETIYKRFYGIPEETPLRH